MEEKFSNKNSDENSGRRQGLYLLETHEQIPTQEGDERPSMEEREGEREEDEEELPMIPQEKEFAAPLQQP